MKGKILWVAFFAFVIAATGFVHAEDGDDLWTQRTSMPTARQGHAVCTVNGKIYAIGGATFIHTAVVSTVEEYDPVTDSWITKANMPTGRRWLSCCVVNEKIYAVGGINDFGYISKKVEEYDPITDTWTTKAPMPTARWGFSTCEVNGKIYAIGGAYGKPFNTTVFGTVEEYDPLTDTWTAKADMPTPRHMHSCDVVNGKIYVIGGVDVQTLSTVEEYDPATDIWATKSPMTTARWGLAVCTVNGDLYAIGGASGTVETYIVISSVEKYDPVTDAWTTKSPSPIPPDRTTLPSCVVNGNIFIIGPSYHDSYSEVFVYDPDMEPISVEEIIPAGFAIVQNYPNPFNPVTTINYRLDHDGMVNLSIYDLLGKKVATLVDEVKPPGEYSISWNAESHASGIYFCHIEYGESKVLTRKMLLLR